MNTAALISTSTSPFAPESAQVRHDSSASPYATAAQSAAVLRFGAQYRRERMDAADMISTDEAAAMAGTTRVTINAWIKSGRTTYGTVCSAKMAGATACGSMATCWPRRAGGLDASTWRVSPPRIWPTARKRRCVSHSFAERFEVATSRELSNAHWLALKPVCRCGWWTCADWKSSTPCCSSCAMTPARPLPRRVLAKRCTECSTRQPSTLVTAVLACSNRAVNGPGKWR